MEIRDEILDRADRAMRPLLQIFSKHTSGIRGIHVARAPAGGVPPQTFVAGILKSRVGGAAQTERFGEITGGYL